MALATNFFDAGFWDRVHGGSTHLPIALALTSALLDGIGSIAPSGKVREGFRFSGYFTLLLAALGAVPAVISGLMLTKWDAVGSGVTLLHHYFVWPSFGLLIALVVWRSIVRYRTSRIGFSIYLIAILTTAVLISIPYLYDEYRSKGSGRRFADRRNGGRRLPGNGAHCSVQPFHAIR
jgi:hypothetical protein